MNWKDYQKLDLKSQNEWKFRFRDKINMPHVSLLWVVILWVNLVTVSTILLSKNNGVVVISSLQLFNLFLFTEKLSMVILLTFIADYIFSLSYAFYWKYQEIQWIKTKVKN